jgi:hypothetical protein
MLRHDASKNEFIYSQDASYIRLIQLPVARAIAAQLILAVAFLHSRGIVHGGRCFCDSVILSGRFTGAHGFDLEL